MHIGPFPLHLNLTHFITSKAMFMMYPDTTLYIYEDMPIRHDGIVWSKNLENLTYPGL